MLQLSRSAVSMVHSFSYCFCCQQSHSWASWGGDSSVGALTKSKKSVVIRTGVRVPGAARDFSPTVNFQRRLSDCRVRDPVCNCMHPNMCAHYKSQTLAATPLFGHTEMLHAPTEMGSAALVAAVPYQVKQPKFTTRDDEVLKK